MLLPLTINGTVWLTTPTDDTLITSSACPIALRRIVPAQPALAGKAAGHPAPFAMEPLQLPNNGSLAACVIVTAWLATVRIAVRLSPVFSAIDTPTVPVPVWLAPEVMVANAALDVAVHAQPLLVVTPIEALAPRLAMLSAVVDSVNVHAVGCGLGDDGDRESEQDAQNSTARSAID